MEFYDAFISYRRKDLHTAEMIRMKLESRGVRCFMDKHEITGGEEWEKKLYETVQQTPNFICILTEDAVSECLKHRQTRKKDYFRKEIQTAQADFMSGKRILSILCKGYRFPDEWDEKMPREIKKLKNLQAIEFNDTDMEASVERIVADMKGVVPSGNVCQYPLDSEKFVAYVSSSSPLPASGRFMFHAGANWFKSASKRDLLETLSQKGIRLRILLNTEKAAMSLAAHMTHPNMRYTPFQDSIADWIKFRNDHPNRVEVRICEIPFLRCLYLFSDENDESGVMRVSYYTYQGLDITKNCCQILTCEENADYFALYLNEFEYLWEHASEA